MSEELKVSLHSQMSWMYVCTNSVINGIDLDKVLLIQVGKTRSSEGMTAGQLVDGLDMQGIRFKGMSEEVWEHSEEFQ